VKIQITEAAERDTPVILDLIRQLAEYERLADKVTASEDRLRATLFGARPSAEVLLARMDGETVGYALFFTTYSTFLARPGLYLEDLFVKEHARGKGIGTALLARLAQLAIKRDYGRVEWTVLDWNEPSIRFYDSLGAVPMTDWILYRLTGEPLAKLAGRKEASQKAKGKSQKAKVFRRKVRAT
jgi:GNAT superfamily N-acetyltransferase